MSATRIGLADGYHLGYPKFRWIERAFQELGCETVRIRNAKDLADADCDLILFSQNIPVDEADFAAAQKKCPWAIWIFDLLGHGVGDMLLESTDWGKFDHVFCKNPEAVEHPSISWLDQGSPPWLPSYKDRKYEVLLPGRWRHSRHLLAGRLRDSGIEFVTAGTGWKHSGFKWIGTANGDEQLRRLFNSAKVVVCDNFAAIPGYWSDRVWMALAGGCSFVGPRVEGLQDSEAIYLWDSEDQIASLVLDALDDHDEDTAWNQAAENTYVDRVAELLERVNLPVLGSVS